MKIATIVGARPQFVKAAVVSRAIQALNHSDAGELQEIIIHTGQHFDAGMSTVFFEELCIPKPDHNLGINQCRHGEMTARMLAAIETVLLDEAPNWVLVYGDTNSTLAGALAAKKLHIPLAHVEAGLRSFNMRMPEEQNRLVADRLSDLLLCPTARAVANLEDEKIGRSPYGERVVRVGDVMYDAAIYYAAQAESKADLLCRLDLTSGAFVLATVHRAENTDDPQRLSGIFTALRSIAAKVPVILPLHPRTAKLLAANGTSTDGILMIEPVSYLEMVLLEKYCQAILTDSGGVQKEAYFFAKPCLTLRDETEWTELVQGGVNFLVGAEPEAILSCFHSLDGRPLDFSSPHYGNGHAGKAVVESLLHTT